MKENRIFGWLIVAIAIIFFGLLGIGEVKHGQELRMIWAGQAEVSAGIAVVGLGLQDLGRQIDSLAEALGQPAVERGLASWYGDESGDVTANGERFDRRALTAAHLKAPFGMRCVVVNLINGRRILVRINDRGPAIKGRVIDVTEGGGADLGMIEAGVVPVRIYLITTAIPSPRPSSGD
jgi:rare lipoprotein A